MLAIHDAAVTSFEINGNFAENDSIRIPQENHITCSKHPGEQLRFVCDCDGAICTTCVLEVHAGHKKTNLRVVADKGRDNLLESTVKFNQRMEAVQQEAEKNLEQFHGDVKGLHEKIRSMKREFIDDITQQVGFLADNSELPFVMIAREPSMY